MLTYAVLSLLGVLVSPTLVYTKNALDPQKITWLVIIPLLILTPVMQGLWVRVTRRSWLVATLVFVVSALTVGAMLVVFIAAKAVWSRADLAVEELVGPWLGSGVADHVLLASVLLLAIVRPMLRSWSDALLHPVKTCAKARKRFIELWDAGQKPAETVGATATPPSRSMESA
jgi:hypothetical protein